MGQVSNCRQECRRCLAARRRASQVSPQFHSYNFIREVHAPPLTHRAFRIPSEGAERAASTPCGPRRSRARAARVAGPRIGARYRMLAEPTDTPNEICIEHCFDKRITAT